jgi:hypothetical protein
MSLEGLFVFCSFGRSAFQPPAVKSKGSSAMTRRSAPAARQCAGAGPRDSRSSSTRSPKPPATNNAGATHCLAHLAAQLLRGALKTPWKQTGPGIQVCRRGKRIHVQSELRQQSPDSGRVSRLHANPTRPHFRSWLWYPEGAESYSYRRISTGSSLAAARAGSIVAPMEMPIATTVIHTPSQILG